MELDYHSLPKTRKRIVDEVAAMIDYFNLAKGRAPESVTLHGAKYDLLTKGVKFESENKVVHVNGVLLVRGS